MDIFLINIIFFIVMILVGLGFVYLGRTSPQYKGRVEPEPQNFSPLPTCSTDPPPICDPQEGGGWGNCNDAQGGCTLRRGCGNILRCSGPFTCTDALGACIWY